MTNISYYCTFLLFIIHLIYIYYTLIIKEVLILTPTQQYYDVLAKKVIAGLEKRHMEGYYCASKEEALEKALSFLPKDHPEDTTVSWGGSVSLTELGLIPALKDQNYDLIDRDSVNSAEDKLEIQRQAFFSDFYFLSTNAITRDGVLYNADGIGNRVAAMIYGPKEVIVIAGMNKVCLDKEEAYKRIRNVAAPINALRLSLKTPCVKTGTCGECLVDHTICSHIVETRNSRPAGRIKVILVGESLGY